MRRADPDNGRMSDSRRFVPIGAVAAALVLGAGVLGAVHLTDRDPEPATGPLPAFAVLPRPAVSIPNSFEGGGDEPIVDAAGGHELRPLGQNGGTLSLVPEG